MSEEFSEQSFWGKIGGYAAAAGRELVEKALVLYYFFQSNRCPVWAKTAIGAALVYFVSPVDAVPDFIPGIGFIDDAGVLVAATASVAAHIGQAKEQTNRLLGPP